LKDKVFIKNLILPCYIGVTSEERLKKQNVIFDIKIFCDLRKAGSSDDINQTVNYFEIKKNVEQSTAKSEFKLLERLAETVAEIVLRNQEVLAVKVAARKEKYSKSPEMGIEISRDRKGNG